MAPHVSDMEISSTLPASQIYKAFCLDFDNLAPKIAPQGFKKIDLIKGDGGVGSIKLLHLGDAVPFESVKQKVDAIDKNNFTYSFTHFEGELLMDIFESITYHMKVEPTPDGGCIFKQRTIYNCKGDAKPGEEHINMGKEQMTGVFKGFEAYVIANPDAY